MKNIVFLPGTLCDARVFARQIEHFAKEGWRIRVPAVRMHEDGLPGFAADLLGRLPESFAMVGSSLGAIVAGEILRQDAKRCSHVALLDANPHVDTEQARKRRDENFQIALDGGFAQFMQDRLIPRYGLCGPEEKSNAMLVLDMALDHGMLTWRGQLDLLLTRSGAVDIFASVDVPMLVAGGSLDEVCPPAFQEEIARARGEVPTLYKGCGHLPMLDDPAAVTASLENLLN